MISVIVLGTGNVASHLIEAFWQAKGVDLIQVYGRNKVGIKKIEIKVNTTSNLDHLEEADVYIIAISDDAISEFSSRLKLQGKLVVHTSGSVAITELKTTANKGVFYPLQTFSVLHNIDFKKVPICIESEKNEDLILLEKLASTISDHVYFIDSAQRKYLHIAAVFINNFVNHIYKIGYDICTKNAIPFEILHPLIKETAEKIAYVNPNSVQTGPAHRNDKKTIVSHIELLPKEQQEIYKLLTRSIQNTYGKKL